MTAKAPTPMPEGMNRDNRPKASAAPPSKFREGSCRHEPKSSSSRPNFSPPAPRVKVSDETTTEYGITKQGNLIRKGFTLEQANSFMKAKEDDKDKGEYRIVSRVIEGWS